MNMLDLTDKLGGQYCPRPVLGGCLSFDLFRTNKHKRRDNGGAIAQKSYYYQAHDVTEDIPRRNKLPDIFVVFAYGGYVSPL